MYHCNYIWETRTSDTNKWVNFSTTASSGSPQATRSNTGKSESIMWNGTTELYLLFNLRPHTHTHTVIACGRSPTGSPDVCSLHDEVKSPLVRFTWENKTKWNWFHSDSLWFPFWFLFSSGLCVFLDSCIRKECPVSESMVLIFLLRMWFNHHFSE